jgi:hypothetical protein
VNEGRQQIEISDDRIDNRQKQYRKGRNEKKKGKIKEYEGKRKTRLFVID